MIVLETDLKPPRLEFDIAIVAVGYERRCRWVVHNCPIVAATKLGLEFGFLAEGSYKENRSYFEGKSYKIIPGLDDSVIHAIKDAILARATSGMVRVFVDISSMSREMIANIALSIETARASVGIVVTIAYAPSKFTGPYNPAPIRLASPIKSALAGWSSQPERPLGTIFGLGCEPGLALGAMQFLEPDKAWLFEPKGRDRKFDSAMKKANLHIADIFDVSIFEYEILRPSATRGRFEALMNAVDKSFRLVIVPFGPKIFAWLSIASVIFNKRNDIGVWAFSSKEQANLVDRDGDGSTVWHNMTLPRNAM